MCCCKTDYTSHCEVLGRGCCPGQCQGLSQLHSHSPSLASVAQPCSSLLQLHCSCRREALQLQEGATGLGDAAAVLTPPPSSPPSHLDAAMPVVVVVVVWGGGGKSGEHPFKYPKYPPPHIHFLHPPKIGPNHSICYPPPTILCNHSNIL